MRIIHAIPLILSILFQSCATSAPDPATIIRPNPEPATITIRTVPAGGIVAYNGDTLGPSPITITTSTRPRNRWPDTGHIFQKFEAHWNDGKYALELFPSNTTVPEVIFLYAREAR